MNLHEVDLESFHQLSEYHFRILSIAFRLVLKKSQTCLKKLVVKRKDTCDFEVPALRINHLMNVRATIVY